MRAFVCYVRKRDKYICDQNYYYYNPSFIPIPTTSVIQTGSYM